MSSAWLDGVDTRIKRAHGHLDTINDHIGEFLKTTKNHVVIKANPDRGDVWLVWWVEGGDRLTLDTSILIGEFLYNLRSALDNLVCALVRIEKPDSSCSGRSFPICIDRNDYIKNASNWLKGVQAKPRKVIDHLQPYKRGNGAQMDPLNILNTLCNRDKHRALRAAAGYSGRSVFQISTAIGNHPICEFIYKKSAFSDGPRTIGLPIRYAQIPNTKLHVEAFGTSAVGFLDPGPWGERSVDEVLVACLDYVENRVILRLKPFFN